ncbi:hypothetical protein LG52_1950 [Geobacillus kaustophilus]|uniref:Uncharacterized protein n=1 Tax=Geobacillus kaustophilus TaxID=1462 RepID=A0A0D8BPQ0_GEOKU|nr:hypothetical protein LG52_1950 [Geobacillus kaustophilus]
MSKSIPNLDWLNQLENAIRQFVKEKCNYSATS